MVEVCRVSMVLVVGSRSDGVTCNPRSTQQRHFRGRNDRGVAAVAGAVVVGSSTRVHDEGVVVVAVVDDGWDSIGDC